MFDVCVGIQQHVVKRQYLAPLQLQVNLRVQYLSTGGLFLFDLSFSNFSSSARVVRAACGLVKRFLRPAGFM